MKIALGCDHAGFRAKERLKAWLAANGHEAVDFGTHGEESCDYPDFCVPAARAVAGGDCRLGFVLGGSGNGEQMAANKVRGARAALVHDEFTAEMARRHNDANVGSFGTRVTSEERILVLAKVFVERPFDGGRHARRVEKLNGIQP